MNRILLILLFVFVALPKWMAAQADQYSGTWQMEYQQPGSSRILKAKLQVGGPEDKILYPAKLMVECDSFSAVYELLLLKKGSRELAVSRNKFARKEYPFSAGNIPIYFNGSFDYSRNQNGLPLLTLNRLPLKQRIDRNVASKQADSLYGTTAQQVKMFFQNTPATFEKLNNEAWQDGYSERITSRALAPAYFGLTDTVHVKNRDGLLYLSGNKKGDVVSVLVNGRLAIDRQLLTKKIYKEDILLDTGLNLLVLYAEGFGNALPSEGKLKLELGKQQFVLDFGNRGDSAAVFIIAKIYCERDEEKDIYFADYNPFTGGELVLQQKEKFLGSLISTSRQLTLAIWDDAVEDGDSISININGDWIARGFPVKKKTQFITVTLKPGKNTINFIADNLGTIAPNTSILEIIDGRKRKSFSLETVLGENNLLKIRYEVQSP